MTIDSRYKKNFQVSWEQIHRDAKSLASRFLGKGPFTSIIAVTRGGLVPAAIVARELEIRLVDTICLSSYDWQLQTGQSQVLKKVEGTGAGCLVIDDLVDSGKTAKIIRAMLPEACFGAVYAKPDGKPLVCDYITEVTQDTWVLFPWDCEMQYVRPIVRTSDPAGE